MIRLDVSDTIAAIASPPGPGVRGIVRLAGANAVVLAKSAFELDDAPWTTGSEHRKGRVRVSALERTVPARLIVWPNEASYTGQPSAEIHTIGSAPLLKAILDDLLRAGARLAEPGEFTLRAFLSGRIDLTRAEAVLGVIEAKNPAQLESALAQLAGGIAGPIEALRDRLLDLLAHMEANLDFAEEPDVDPVGRSRIAEELQVGAQRLRTLADRLQSRDRDDARPRVLLYGPPNAGKSRLFNALIGSAAAIVAPEPGTTRDYLVGICDCEGLEVELIDTPGVEQPRDAIERAAALAREREASAADLIVVCRAADSLDHVRLTDDQPHIVIATKCDLAKRDQGLATSAATGEGLESLRTAIANYLRSGNSGDAVPGTSERCRESLIRASESLQSGSDALTLGGGDELVAIDLRQALDDLGRVVGETVADDVLDRIFRRFCIGK